MRNALLCSALALLAWGCSGGDGPTPPPVATTIAVSPGSISMDAAGETRVVHATVLDQDGEAMPGASVSWSSNLPIVTVAGAGGDSAVVTSAGNGTATITASSGAASGAVTVQVTQVATALVKVAGDAQTSTAGSLLVMPVQVGARDRLGAPVTGVSVTFAVVGGGTISISNAVTGANGVATTQWTLGTQVALAQQVIATLGGVSVQFTATSLPRPPSSATVVAGNDQTAAAGAVVAVPPRVVVRDTYGNPVPGVSVQFGITSGGGTVTGPTQTTNPDGQAQVGSWKLGSAVGPNTLTATFPGTSLASVQFVANVVPDAVLTIAAGDNQAAMVGTTVGAVPSVVLRNGAGQPLPGVSVTFAVLSGGGSVTGATATTNAGGVATVGSWTLGATAGPNTLRASVTGVTAVAVVFRGIGCAGGGAGYALTLCYTTTMTAAQRTVFQNSAARWASIITADLPDVSGSIPAGSCGTGSPAFNLPIDDLVIFAGIETIDGPGAVLGQAGPCFIRSGSELPVIGIMRFDVADVAGLETTGQFGSVILHEMGHVLGIGSLWAYKGLLGNPSTASSALDTYFTGSNALVGFNAIGGASYTGGQKVPVENTGGPGTMNSHWRESVLANELMTGYLNGGTANPLSELTVRSLTDLGYTVNVAAADAFSVALSLRAGQAAPSRGLRLHNDVYNGPRYVIDRQGRITRMRN